MNSYDTEYICEGGVGIILLNKNNINEIYKMTFMPIAFENNIKFYDIFSKVKFLNPVPLISYDKISFNDKNPNIIKKKLNKINTKMFTYYLNEKTKLEALNVLDKDNINLFIIKYSRMNGSVYQLLIKESENANFKNLLIFTIYWAFCIIIILNKLGFNHNDFKLDNILFKKKEIPGENILFYDNIILINSFDFNYYINDFDLTSEKCINNDLTKFKESINNFINKHIKDKSSYINIQKKLQETNTIDDITNNWINNKFSTYRNYLISNLIDEYLWQRK